jgi:hypothetical protein
MFKNYIMTVPANDENFNQGQSITSGYEQKDLSQFLLATLTVLS